MKLDSIKIKNRVTPGDPKELGKSKLNKINGLGA